VSVRQRRLINVGSRGDGRHGLRQTAVSAAGRYAPHEKQLMAFSVNETSLARSSALRCISCIIAIVCSLAGKSLEKINIVGMYDTIIVGA